MALQSYPRVSVVIPAYNEAEMLPKLLGSLAVQTQVPYEVIVADGASTDGTRRVAEAYGCILVAGGLPAVGRNAGAAVATGEYLLFLDADVVLPNEFLAAAHAEFDERYLELATVIPRPDSGVRIDQLFFSINGLLMKSMQQHYPVTFGAVMLMTRRLFWRVGGFDPSLRIDEDNHFGRQARKFATFGVLTSTEILLSVRRFETEGRLRLIHKYLQQGMFRQLKALGIDRSIEYEFGQFAAAGNLTDAEQRLEDLLATIEEWRTATRRQAEKVKTMLHLR